MVGAASGGTSQPSKLRMNLPLSLDQQKEAVLLLQSEVHEGLVFCLVDTGE